MTVQNTTITQLKTFQIIDDVLENLDGFCGSVSTTGTIMKQCFADGQKESESILEHK